jgi:hypothetical protein
VSNYRVRQVLALKPKLLDSKLRLMVALATWMNDASMTATVSFDVVTEQAQLARNTARDARRALAADGYLTWTSPHGRGNRTVWTFHRLPELKGVSDTDLFPEAGAKGVSDADPFCAAEKGSIEGQKRGQSERADLLGRDYRLNRQANPLSPADATADAGPGDRNGERDNHLTRMLRKAAPNATPEEIQRVVVDFQDREATGKYRSAVAVMRTAIEKGDAPGLIEKARREIAKDERKRAQASGKPRRCRVCHGELDRAVGMFGVHPNCEQDLPPDPFTRRTVPPEVTERGAARVRAALEGHPS